MQDRWGKIRRSTVRLEPRIATPYGLLLVSLTMITEFNSPPPRHRRTLAIGAGRPLLVIAQR